MDCNLAQIERAAGRTVALEPGSVITSSLPLERIVVGSQPTLNLQRRRN